MKKLLLILIVLTCQSSISQELTETQKLATTCKVWGFLKYYHPNVASGKFNWDEQLFAVLPMVEKASTKEQFSTVLENWIDSLGEIKKIAPIKDSDSTTYFYKNLDLAWIKTDNIFSKKLSFKLKFIENNRYQGELHYFYFDEKDGGMGAINEHYSNINFKDKNARIVTMFMYWNLIEYFFPYKYLMDQKWSSTLEKLLPEFIEANDVISFSIAMQKLTAKLNDSHVVFYTGALKHALLPIKCKVIDEKLIITEIFGDEQAKYEDLEIGDVITKVNDKTIHDLIAENRKLIGGSNEAYYLKNLASSILDVSSDTIKLTFLKDGVTNTRIINTYDILDAHSNEKREKKITQNEKFKIVENNIGYVNMGTLKVKNVPDMIETLKTTKAIIFDMRNYPNQTYEAVTNFLNATEKEFAKYTHPDTSYPGRFVWTEPAKCGTNNKDNYKGKVIVLLNENSISQSEWTAMCFQTSGNTTIIGSQTAGSDGNVTEINFVKAFYTCYTGIGVYYPDGRETQRIGIVPDIEVKPTIEGIKQGKDEVLERAIKFIETGK